MRTAQKILTVIGPTGVGKTKFVVKLAKFVNGEIISADSRQVYKHLNIGTAKPTSEELNGIPIHLIDIVLPDENYSCGQFARDAERKIEEVKKRERVPIICGGTGLYIKALFEPLHILPQSDKRIKEILNNILKEKGISFLYQRLLEVDPHWARSIKPNDRQRIMRGLEVYEITGKPLSSIIKNQKPPPKFQPFYIGLLIPREELYKKIDARFDQMIQTGLVDEVKGILDMGYDPACPGLKTIGYKEIVDYILGNCSLPDAIRKAKQHTRNLAKRQITWFSKILGVKWYKPDVVDLIPQILQEYQISR
ncbi:MAG: tRNA (adenosine(37)-N6)-dimethylallyltransferase MiaA [candidate division WOR-3 bacterium]